MIENTTTEPTRLQFRLSFTVRLGLLGVLLIAEKLGLNTLVDTNSARNAAGLEALVHSAQHWGLRVLVTFMAVVAVLAYVRTPQPSDPRETYAGMPELRIRWMIVHAFLVAVFLAPLSFELYRTDFAPWVFAAMAILWVVIAVAAVMAVAIGLAPWAIWRRGIRSLGIAWLYAALAALLGTAVWQQSEKLWTATAGVTFTCVKWVLTPSLPYLSTDAATHVIRADHFAVEITEMCSGLEGLGLMLAFSIAWLVYFRREYMFPRALLLIPVSLAAMFGLNVLRICALLLIGNAGYPEVASFGFHSQAGWIAFNAVACALVFVSRRSRWLNRTAATVETGVRGDNPTALYLMPLLAILAAGTLSHAMSGRFETLYPLRFVAAVAVLLIYRRRLWARDWRVTWRGPAMGALVFELWELAARVMLPASPMPDALAAMSPAARDTWIAVRLLASVLTVPLAEELAYRGYLMRRLKSVDFESLPYRNVGWTAMTLSALAFGAVHGVLWAPGILAGLAYGLLVMRSGRLGEAVMAHATTNALVALAVLDGGEWRLW